MADHLRTEGKFRSLRELAWFRLLRKLAWCSTHWIWRWGNDTRPRSSITPTKAASTPRSPSVNAAANGAWRRPPIEAFEGRPPIEASPIQSLGDCFDNAMAQSFFATLEWHWAACPHSTSRGATRKLHDTQALNRPLKRGKSISTVISLAASARVSESPWGASGLRCAAADRGCGGGISEQRRIIDSPYIGFGHSSSMDQGSIVDCSSAASQGRLRI